MKIDSMLNLDYRMSMPRVQVEKLLYTKLAQGTGQIILDVLKNFSANYHVLVFICVKYLELSTTTSREMRVIRLLF